MGGIFAGKHIPVCNHRDGEGGLDLSDYVPIGPAGVHLGTGAAVNGHGGHAGVLKHFGKLHAVDVSFVPTLANFHRYRNAARTPDYGPDDLFRLLRVTHQGRTVAAVDNLGDGTAHVYVQHIRPGMFQGQRRRPLHRLRVTAENLHRRRMLLLAKTEEGDGFFILIAKGLGTDHLADGIACAQLPAHRSEGNVGHPGHRGEGNGSFNRYVSYLHTSTSFSVFVYLSIFNLP